MFSLDYHMLTFKNEVITIFATLYLTISRVIYSLFESLCFSNLLIVFLRQMFDLP